MTALAGLAVAALLWWGLKAFARATPGQVKALGKRVAAFGAFALAALLMLRGQLEMAALAGGAGAWLLGWSGMPRIGPWRNLGTSGPPRTSRVRSRLIEMELDGGTGRLSGRVLSGARAGTALDDLDAPALRRLLRECLGGDPEGVRLLETYLDRRFPRWREDAEADPDRGRRSEPKRGPMAEQEAYEILGLQPGASAGAVRDAHRALMKKLHPDQGGSTYLASRVNQAKDVLLDRHR